MRGRIIRLVLVSLLSGLSLGSDWVGVLYSPANAGPSYVEETTIPDTAAILLLGLALLSMANLLRRRQTRNDTFDLRLKSADSPAPRAIGRELCPESSVRT